MQNNKTDVTHARSSSRQQDDASPSAAPCRTAAQHDTAQHSTANPT
jgi:hypothetical protein